MLELLTLAKDPAYRPEGSVTLMLVAFLIAMGMLMGLVFLTKVSKEWSR